MSNLPNNTDAEKNIIGSILIEPETMDVANILTSDDFFDPNYKKIFKVLKDAYIKNQSINILTLSDELQRSDKSKNWLTFLNEIIDDVISTVHIKTSVEIVKNKSILRKLSNIGENIKNLCRKEPRNIEELLLSVENQLITFNSDFSTIQHDILTPDELAEEVYNFMSDDIKGHSTGIKVLDECWKLARGELVVITGTPNAGKSEFMDFLATNLIKTHDWKFLYFSPENTKGAHGYKLARYFIQPPFKKDEILKTIKQLSCKNIKIINYDKLNNIDGILFRAKQVYNTNGLDCLVIDPYNQLRHNVNTNKYFNETTYILEFLNKLTSFAKKYNIIVFIVAHTAKLRPLSDTEKKNQEKKYNKSGTYEIAQLYHISGSAHWYNKADVGLSVYRFEDNTTKVFVQKVRKGHLGRVGSYIDLKYNKNLWQFEVVTDEAEECTGYDDIPF